MERVSIIVPVLSTTTKQDLTDCVASVMGQTYPELELLLVGKTSNTTALKLKYPKITIIPTVEQLNASSCRNLGVISASGTYISFVNADEILEPQFIATLVNAMKQTSSDMVISAGHLLQVSSARLQGLNASFTAHEAANQLQANQSTNQLSTPLSNKMGNPLGNNIGTPLGNQPGKSQAMNELSEQSIPENGQSYLQPLQSLSTLECIDSHHLFDIPYEASGKLFKRSSYEDAGLHFDENQNLWESNKWHLQCMFGLKSLTLIQYQGLHRENGGHTLTKENLCAYFDTLAQCYELLKQHGYATLYDNFFLKFVAHSWVQRALLATSRQDQIAVFKYGWQLMHQWGYNFDLNLEAAEQQQRRYQQLGENSHDLGLKQEAEHCATLRYVYELIAYFLQHLNLRKLPY